MKVMEEAVRPAVGASDVQLVRATREEDERAFAELYRRYHGPIAGYVRRIVRDGGRAEEVAQETFLSALRRIRQTDSEIQFKPWIYQIARNAAIDHHRRSGRIEEMPFDDDGVGAEVDLVASTTPEAAAVGRERFEHFRGALDELSETQRRIIVLRELDGLSYREIGVRMQLSSAAVESALFRARRKLQAEYEQLDSGRRCIHIRGVMARLANGSDSGVERGQLDRHARRCWSCRRRAREIGLRPPSVSRRALGLLPLPGFLRRLLPGADPNAAGAREAASLASTPAFEPVTQGIHKAAVVVASAIAIGGGGATLGGAGPLATHSGATTVDSAREAVRESSLPVGPGRAGTRPTEMRLAASRDSARREKPAGDRGSGGGPSRARTPAPDSQPPPPSGQQGGSARGAPAAQGIEAPSSGGKTPILERLPQPVVSPLPPVPRVPDLPDLSLDKDLGVPDVQGVLPDVSGTVGGATGALPPP